MTASALPAISVVVAAYNAEETIGDCVRSLLALRYPRDLFEIVVVDNGSQDATRRVLDAFGEEIVLAEERMQGPAAARNAGVRVASGSVIALTDADCTVDPQWLTELVPPLADDTVGIVGGTNLARRPANAAELYGETIHDHRRAILYWWPPHVITMNWAARRSLFDAVGQFDECLPRGSDVEFSYRVVSAGYRLAFSPGAIIYHRNERSLAGLLHEGWVHGRHGARIHRVHAAVIAEAAARERQTPRGRADLGSRPRNRFSLAFGLGKRVGRVTARLDFAAKDVQRRVLERR